MAFALWDVREIYSNYDVFDDQNDPATGYLTAGGGPRDEVVMSLLMTSTDTVPHVVELWRGGGSTPTAKVLSAILPANAGDGTVPALDLLAGLAPTPCGLFLNARASQLFVFVRTAISTGTFVYIDPIIGMF